MPAQSGSTSTRAEPDDLTDLAAELDHHDLQVEPRTTSAGSLAYLYIRNSCVSVLAAKIPHAGGCVLVRVGGKDQRLR